VLQLTCRSIVELWSKVSVANPPSIGNPGHAGSAGLDFVERIMLLRQSSVFARASLNALAELSRGMVELALEPGTALWRTGEPARGVILVVSGELQCDTPASGNSFLARPGAPLGAAESIAGLPRFYDAVAKGPVVCLYGDMEGMLDVFEDNFDMAASYLAVTSRWLLGLVEMAAEQEVARLGAFYGCELEPETP
jgi:CRP-like cAMP-binding protein